ncbi:MAG TPA: hypothetical protein DCO77_13665 [Nitrospiraceae bacterium]|nr:hypothetical protein [Nitrospiraceae bacterium]
MMNPDSEQQFFPNAFFEITIVILFAVEAVLILAVLFPAEIGREINFSAQYSPRPEWYFLFLYELTKYFPGRWTFVGAVLLPGFAFSVLLMAPFLDRGPDISLRKRKAAAITGFGLLTAVLVLTILSLL